MINFESYPSGSSGVSWNEFPEFQITPLKIKGKSGLPLIIHYSPPDGRKVVDYLAVTDANAFKIDKPTKPCFILEAQVKKDSNVHVASFGLYSLARFNSFAPKQEFFQDYQIPDDDPRKQVLPDFTYRQPDFFAREFILGFLKRCQDRNVKIDYIQDWWNRQDSIVYDQFMSLFSSKNYFELTNEERERWKIYCASQTWSANVYAQAGFRTIKNVIVDTQYNLSAAAQFWS